LSLGPLTFKEIKSLLRDRAFVASLIIAPIILLSLGAAESHAINKTIQEERIAFLKTKILIVTEDKGNLTNEFVKVLSSLGRNVTVTKTSNASPIDYLNKGYTIVLLIPKGFSKNITAGKPGSVELYTKVKRVSVSVSARTSGISSILEIAFKQALAKAFGIPQSILLSPINVKSHVFVPSIGILSPQELNSLTWIPLTIGMIFLILIIVVAQLSALSMSFEREERTLELLLSLPIPRTSIILSKIVGAFVVSIIEVIVFAASMIGYIRLITGAGGLTTGPIMKVLSSPFTLTLLSLSMIVSLLFVSSIAMLLGLFGKDPRSSQGIATSVITPLALIGYFVTLSGVPTGTLGYAIGSIPTAHVVISVLAPLQGSLKLAIYSLLINTVYTVISIYVLIRVASSERLLIGFKFPLRKRLRGT
jgi:ABC-2 type transport system permease protein